MESKGVQFWYPGLSYPLHCRFQAANPLYIREFQKCPFLPSPNQNHQDSGCMGVARLERGISTQILHPPLSALRSRKRRKTLPLCAQGRDRRRGFSFPGPSEGRVLASIRGFLRSTRNPILRKATPALRKIASQLWALWLWP